MNQDNLWLNFFLIQVSGKSHINKNSFWFCFVDKEVGSGVERHELRQLVCFVDHGNQDSFFFF